jgi:hypothetical protein
VYKRGNDLSTDLAVLELRTPLKKMPSAHLLRAEDTSAAPGEDVFFCGHGIVPWNLQRGFVNQNRLDFFMINGVARPGHSGSGVFVKRGSDYKLAGVLVAGLNDGTWEDPIICVRGEVVTDFVCQVVKDLQSPFFDK